MPRETIPVQGLDQAGLILDTPAVNLPPNAFSDGRNIRFHDGSVSKMPGHEGIFSEIIRTYNTNGTGGVGSTVAGFNTEIVHIAYWPNPNGDTYIVITNEGHVYTVTPGSPSSESVGGGEGNAVRRTLTAAGADEPMMFTADANWQVTIFNGGYTAVVNNGLETPRHMTDSQDLDGGSDLRLEPLPGWDSYMAPRGGDTENMVQVASVTAGNIVTFGNLLAAGDLTERDADGNLIRDLRGVVRTSDVAEPGQIPQNWNPFNDAVNTADEIIIADTGRITAMEPLQGNLYVYTTKSINQLRISEQGLSQVPVTTNYGAVGRDAVIEFDGSHLVVGSEDIYIFAGHPGSIQSVSDGRVRRNFYNTAHYFFIDRVQITRNIPFDEVWISISTEAITNGDYDRAYIWNYRDNTWSIRDLPNIRSIDVGPIPGGGVSNAQIVFDTAGSSDLAGQATTLSTGTAEVQSLTVTATAQARHDGIDQQQEALFALPSGTTEHVFEGREIFDITINNDSATVTAAPNLVSAVNTMDFTGVVPLKNTAIAGGTRLTAVGRNRGENDVLTDYNVTVDASFDFTDSDLVSYLDALVTHINGDNVVGWEDYTVARDGNLLRFTSDVMGLRTFVSGNVTTYTGMTSTLTGPAPGTANDITISATSNPASGTYSSFDSGTITSGGAGGISASTTSTPGSTTTNVGALSTTNPANGGYRINDLSQTSFWFGRGVGRGNLTITHYPQPNLGGHPTSIFQYQQDDNPGQSILIRGGAFQTGDHASSPFRTLTTGSLSIGGNWTQQEHGTRTVTTTTSPTTYDISFTNNNNYIVGLNGNSTGGARELTPGQTVQVVNDSTSNQYRIASDGGSQDIVAVDSTTSPAGGITARTTTTPGSTQTAPLAHQSVGTATTVGSWFTSGTGGNRDGFMVINFDANTALARLNWGGGGGLTSAIRDGGTLVQSGNAGNVFARGPAWRAGDSGLGLTAADWAAAPQISANGQISLGYQGNSPSRNGSATGRCTRGADIVTPETHDIFFNNTNNYPITLNSNSTGGVRTLSPNSGDVLVQNDGSSSNFRIAFNRQAISLGTVDWTATSTRTQPLQEDVQNFSINAGGANIDFGVLEAGTTRTVRSAGGQTATSGTWSGQIFDTELATFNQTTSAGGTTNVGTVTVTRRDGGTTTDSQSTSTTATSGTANTGTGGGGYANNHNWNTSATRLTFPANTTVDQTINYTWSYTGITWMYLGTQRDWRIQGTGQSTLTIGGQTYRNTTGRWQPSSGQNFYFNETGVSGVWGFNAHRFYWSETAGSGLNIQVNGANAPEYNGPGAPSLPTGNSQALLNNQSSRGYPQLVDSLLAVANDFNFPANPVDGQIFSVPPQTTNGTIRIHGTTGGSGSTLRMYIGEVVSNSLRTGWAPRNIGTVSGNQSTTVQLYDYDARVAANQGPATLTHADGDIADVSLTTSDQEVVTATRNSQINIQGNYTVVSGTANDQGARTVVSETTGNGVYGFPNSDAPYVALALSHTGANAFNVTLPPFSAGVDTPEEYRDFLLGTLITNVEFTGLDPLDPDTGDQPTGAVFHIQQSPDRPNAVRFTNVDADDHDPFSFTATTNLNGVNYDEDHFGGGVMELAETVVDSTGSNVQAPVLSFDHQSAEGAAFNVRTIYYGRYDTPESLALPAAAAINTVPNFTATTDGNGTVQVTKNLATEENNLITISQDYESGITLPVFAQTRAGDQAETQTPLLDLADPVLLNGQPRPNAISLDGLGDVDGVISSEDIAGRIRTLLNTDTATTDNWTISGTGATVTFTAKPVPTTNASGIAARVNTVDTTGNGRAVTRLWQMIVSSYGETGTTTTQFPMSTDFVQTVEGVNPEYGTQPTLAINFSNPAVQPPLTFDLSNQTSTQAQEAVLNDLQTVGAVRATADANIINVRALDTSANGLALQSVDYLQSERVTTNGDDNTFTLTGDKFDTTSDFNITPRGIVTTTNADRPWPAGEFNEGQIYPVFATATQTFAADLGFTFATASGMTVTAAPYHAYIERTHFHVTPTKDTEHVAEFHVHASGELYTANILDENQTAPLPLDVEINVSNITGLPVSFAMPGMANVSTEDSNYQFDIHSDYKVDVRETGRFFNVRIGDSSDDFWRLASFAIEVGKGGTR